MISLSPVYEQFIFERYSGIIRTDSMWIVFALLSSVFAGLTAILAKAGIKRTDSNLATAIRTIVVLAFSFLMCLVSGSKLPENGIGGMTLLFLILSGLSTGASWLCYFKALSIGDAGKVAVVDKSSTVIAMILSFIIFSEPFTVLSALAVIAVGAGTYLMVDKKGKGEKSGRSWLIYALLSALFASLTTILGKIGVSGIDSNIGSTVRTAVVLVMAWLVVFIQKKESGLRQMDRRELLFIIISGIATGASWLCYYRALKDGLASVVISIDRLSVFFTVLFSYIIFREKQNRRSLLGLLCLVAGTIMLLVPVIKG